MKVEQTPEHVWLFWYRASTLLANSIAERTCSDVDTRRDSLRKKSPSMELPKRHHQNKVDGLHALRRKPFGRARAQQVWKFVTKFVEFDQDHLNRLHSRPSGLL